MGAVACAIRHRPVSHPRSSNRTCGFPASGFPTGFIVGIRHEKDTSVIRVFPPPWRHDTAFSDGSRPHEVLDRLAPSHRPSPSSKAHQKSGPFPPPELPGLSGTTTLSDTHPRNRPTTAMRPLPSREVGLPRLPRSPFQRAVPITPVDRNRCMCRLLPCPRGLPRYSGGSASTPSLSRPAQASLALRPAGSLNRPRRPLSQGFDPAGYPTDPPASYQINRQLSGRNLPPLVTCAVGAHRI